MLHKVLDSKIAIYGESNIECLRTLAAGSSFAVVYLESGRNDEAQLLLRETRAGYTELFSNKHGDQLVVLHNSGNYVYSWARYRSKDEKRS